VRPVYDRVLSLISGRSGLHRLINGTDEMYALPGVIGEVCEPVVWHAMMSLVRPADTIADVGANCGVHTVAFAKRSGPSGKVFAFEPDSSNLVTLEAHVRINHLEDRVSVIKAAVGQSCGDVHFTKLSDTISHVSLEGWRHPNAAREGEDVIVPMVTLDSVFPDSRVDFIKIDVEGYEEPVLRGAQHLLADRARRPRAIVVEVHPFAWQAVGTTSDSLLALLTNAGYRVESIEGAPVTGIESYGHIIAIAA
jgi:FkbM family methyltransferase